jgi:hypothetical protein
LKLYGELIFKGNMKSWRSLISGKPVNLKINKFKSWNLFSKEIIH